jgi:hypothetical protein
VALPLADVVKHRRQVSYEVLVGELRSVDLQALIPLALLAQLEPDREPAPQARRFRTCSGVTGSDARSGGRSRPWSPWCAVVRFGGAVNDGLERGSACE